MESNELIQSIIVELTNLEASIFNSLTCGHNSRDEVKKWYDTTARIQDKVLALQKKIGK